jgi:hypothetical protein
VDVTGTSMQMVSDTGYLADNAGQVTLILPANPAIGDLIQVSGVGAGGFKIQQNSGQQVYVGLKNVLWVPHASPQTWNAIAASADGTHLVASDGASLFTSADAGNSWTQGASSGAGWVSLASSADGTKLIAGQNGAPISLSVNSGATWTAQAVPSIVWQGVASSADGTKLYGFGFDGNAQTSSVYASFNAGAAWAQIVVPSSDIWVAMAASSDGVHLMLAGFDPNSGLRDVYVSANSGTNWSHPLSGTFTNWSSVAMSSDGTRMYAAGAGQVAISSDSGATFAAASQGDSGNYNYPIVTSGDGSTVFTAGSALSLSTDAGGTWTGLAAAPLQLSALVVSQDGLHLFGSVSDGYIYNPSAISTAGTSGLIMGTQHQSLTLQYVGGGQFMLTQNEGQLEVE